LAHLTDEPEPLENVPAALGDAVVMALAKDPAARPRTPTMYARLLQAAAAGS
jgi:hypothetical protein